MAEQFDPRTFGTRRLRATVQESIDEAQQLGAHEVQAEHVLLALSRARDESAALLADVGLDHDGILAALRVERDRSLAAADVAPVPDVRLQATPQLRPRWGASMREAMLRGGAEARRARRNHAAMRGVDVLAGILSAEFGTVPRALAYAGIDRVALRDRAREGGRRR